MLKGKYCLVTGGGRGIGKAIALEFAKEGGSLALAARSADQLEAVKKECLAAGAPSVDVRAVDFSNPASVDGLTKELLDAHGCVDVLVNNAAMLFRDNPLDSDPDDWEKLVAVNVNAPMRLTRRLSPAMKEKGGGVIINMGSVYGQTPFPMCSSYATTKYAMRGWSLCCAEVLREHNIKVVLIAPGYTRTDMTSAEDLNQSVMVDVQDVVAACMLPFKVSSTCIVKEILLTEAGDPFKL